MASRKQKKTELKFEIFLNETLRPDLILKASIEERDNIYEEIAEYLS